MLCCSRSPSVLIFGKLKAHIIQFIILTILVASTAILTKPVQTYVAERLNQIKNEIMAELETLLGMDLAYDSLSPTLISALEIRNLRLSDKKREIAVIRNLRVAYNVSGLLRARRGISIREVNISNATIDINGDTDRKYLELLSKLGSGSPKKNTAKISGRNIHVLFRQSSMRAELSRLFFSLRLFDDRIEADIRCKGEFIPEIPLGGLEFIRSDFSISGSLDRAFAWSRMKVRFDRLSSNMVSIPRLMFQVTSSKTRWDIVKIQDSARMDLSASILPESKMIALTFLSDKFRPDTFINLGTGLAGIKDWLALRLSGTASFAFNWGTGRYSYGGDLTTSIDNRRVPFPIQVHGIFSGNDERITFTDFKADTEFGNATFVGSVDLRTAKPEGLIRIENLPLFAGESGTGDFIIGYNSAGILLRSFNASLKNIAFRELSLNISSLSLESLEFSLFASLQTALETRDQFFFIDGSLRFSPFFLQAESRIANMPINAVIPLAEKFLKLPQQVISNAEKLVLSAEVFFTSDGGKFSFVSRDFRLNESGDGPEADYLKAVVSGTNDTIIVPKYELSLGKAEASGSFSAAFKEEGKVEFTTQSTINGYAFKLDGAYVPQERFTLQGSFGINVLVLWNRGRYNFTAMAKEFPLPFFEENPLISMNVSGFFKDRDTWEAEVRDCTLVGLPILKDLAPELIFSAKITKDKFTLNSVDYQDLVSRLEGSGELSIESYAPFIGAGKLSMESMDGNEKYGITLGIKQETLNAQVTMQNASLSRIKDLPVEGKVTGSALVSGSIKNPDISGTLSMKKGKLFGEEAGMEVSFSADAAGIRVPNMSLSYRNHTLQSMKGELDFKAGSLSLTGNYKSSTASKPISANLSLRGKSVASLTRADLPLLTEKAWTGNFQITNIKAGQRVIKDWLFAIDRHDKKTLVFGGPESAVSVSIDEESNFRFILTDPLPVRLSAYGSFKKSEFEAVADVTEVDIEALKSVLAIPFFQLEKGKGKGWLAVSGSLRDPDFSGELTVKGAIARNRLFPSLMGPFDTTITFDGKSMDIPKTKVPIALGSADVTCSFVMDHWIPRTYEIVIDVPKSRSLPVADVFAGIQINGYVDGNILINGDFDGLALMGKLNANTCSITLGERKQGADRPEKSPFIYSIDLGITLGQQMEFLWPTRDIPIFRAFAETNSKINITYDSDMGDYSITGDVPIKGGQIYYFSRSFYIREGKISFNENQESFDPRISVRAEIREISSSGEDARIYLVVNDSPFSKFIPRFKSEPTLPESEIFAMLGQNIMAGLGGQDINISSAVATTSNILFAQFGLLRPIEDKIKEWFKLDLFSLRTQMMETLLKEKVFGLALPTYDTTPFGGFGKYLDNTTLFLGKYFGNDIFIEAMFGLRSKTTPYTDQLYTEELALESELTFEWKTPLALLEFTFIPDLEDLFGKPPEARLSLSWRFTF